MSESPPDFDDDEPLLRRVPPWHHPVDDQSLGRDRPPSAAFGLDDDEEGLSFHLERSLIAAGESLMYGCPDEPGWSVVRLTVGQVRALNLEIRKTAEPHHVEVHGLKQLGRSQRDKIQRALARQAEYIHRPGPNQLRE